jgi:hypothetical protein
MKFVKLHEVKPTWALWGALAFFDIWLLGIAHHGVTTNGSDLLRDIVAGVFVLSATCIFIDSSLRAVSGDSFASVRRGILRLTLMACVCMALAQFGDQLIALAISDPLHVSAGLTVILLSKMIYDAFPTLSPRTDAQAGQEFRTSPGFGAPAAARHPTERDALHAATHEAGHVLPHAALGELPSTFEAVVRKDVDNLTDSLGHVSGARDGDHLLRRRTFAETNMLILLAGTAAEKTMLVDHSLGGINDFRQWFAQAHSYLSTGVRGLYFAEPRDALQMQVNEAALNTMQDEQEALLTDFFALNRDVLVDLREALLVQRRLDAAALKPFMERVRFPQGWPS